MIDCAVVVASSDECGACPTCGDRALWGRGPRLIVVATSQPLCRDCGRTHAPHLIALLDLASTADKVGKHCRHLLTPPMKALLELARAAETFADASPTPRVRAG